MFTRCGKTKIKRLYDVCILSWVSFVVGKRGWYYNNFILHGIYDVNFNVSFTWLALKK